MNQVLRDCEQKERILTASLAQQPEMMALVLATAGMMLLTTPTVRK